MYANTWLKYTNIGVLQVHSAQALFKYARVHHACQQVAIAPNFTDKKNFRKPGMCQPAADVHLV